MKDSIENFKSCLEGWTIVNIKNGTSGIIFKLTKEDQTKEIEFCVDVYEQIYLDNEKRIGDGEETFINIDMMIQEILDHKLEYAYKANLFYNDDDPFILEDLNGDFACRYEIITDDSPKKLQIGFKALPSGKTWHIKISDIKNSKSKFRELFPTIEGREILLEILNKYGYRTDKYPKEWKDKYPALFT